MVGSLGLLREMLKPGLCCSLPTPQLRAEGLAAALLQRNSAGRGACHGRLGALLWGLKPRGLANQGLKADFSLIEEVSLGQYNRGVSAAPALRLGSWASCQSQSRPWKKRQHQVPGLELCMRRSAYQNLRFPEGACPRMCMEPAPSRACRARPCPSRMPGPAPLPRWRAELREGGRPQHQSRGASPGEQRGWCAGLSGGTIPALGLRQRPGGNRGAPDACLAGSLEQTLLSSTVPGLRGLPAEGGSCSPFGPEAEGMGQCRHSPQHCQGSRGWVAGGFVCGAGPSEHR